MRRTKKLNGKSFALFIALSAGICTALSATVTHAGFQWVPPASQQAPASETAPPAEPVPTENVDQMVLPMPEETAPLQPQPQLNAGDAAALNAAPATTEQLLQLPKDYEAVPDQAPAQPQQNVLKVKTVTPPAQSAEAVPAPVQQQPLQSPEPISLSPEMESVNSAPQSAPAWQPAPEPVATTKVIMPQDAPQTAVDSTPNSERLVINPFPGQQAPQQADAWGAPAQQPMQHAPALPAEGDFAVVEGFGSDLPLALAVQQIVPPGYAYSFGESVNPGLRVSWDGGKPWNQIITDMLAPVNLEAVIHGKIVHIQQPGTYRQGEAQPQNTPFLRRANIMDPGEQSQPQAANSLAGIESASGTEAAPLRTETQDLEANAAPAAAAQATEAPEAGNTLPAPAPMQWQAKAGESLKETLTRWSAAAGVEMIWLASHDYKIKDDITLSNSFSEAVQNIVAHDIDSPGKPVLQVMNAPDGSAPESLIVKDQQG